MKTGILVLVSPGLSAALLAVLHAADEPKKDNRNYDNLAQVLLWHGLPTGPEIGQGSQKPRILQIRIENDQMQGGGHHDEGVSSKTLLAMAEGQTL